MFSTFDVEKKDTSDFALDCSDMSLVMRNPVYAICEQQSRRSASAS